MRLRCFDDSVQDEDELFHVIEGRLIIELEGGREVVLHPGEFFVVPRGVMHNPVADEECSIVLIETVTTKHTGDLDTRFTKTIEQQLLGSGINGVMGQRALESLGQPFLAPPPVGVHGATATTALTATLAM